MWNTRECKGTQTAIDSRISAKTVWRVDERKRRRKARKEGWLEEGRKGCQVPVPREGGISVL